MNRILIAGGTGFVGKVLSASLAQQGYTIHILTRNTDLTDTEQVKYFHWNPDRDELDVRSLEGVDTLINLSGTGIGDSRWTTRRKKEIIDSRVKPLDLLYRYIETNRYPVHTLISSSAVGYYGAVTTATYYTEEYHAGYDFLAEVCQKWEEKALQFEKLGIRTLILRKGVVIGPEGGIYRKLAPLARRGINTAVGNGKQFVPWIDLRDLCRLYIHLLHQPEIKGIYNAVASESATMNEFSATLLSSFGKKSFMPNVPAFLIDLLYGEMSIMLLYGSRISNLKLKETGFTFEYDSLKESLDSMK